ncbi:MAG: PAS domain-containing sensor histidine kinase [Ruminiclostridium sp.]|nr:PAS domain-containing sensor histidine kinase [Ruminiclostridium sp.]
MKAPTLTGRVFRVIFLTVSVILTAALIVLVGELYRYFSGVHYDSLESQTSIIAYGVEHYGTSFIDSLEHSDYDVAWIDSEGNVICDTSDDEMARGEREAFMEALRLGQSEGMSIRPTLTEKNIYSARRLTDGSVIIVSELQFTFFSPMMGFIQRVVVIAFISALIAFVVAKVFAARIVKPLGSIDLDAPVNTKGYEELMPLLERIDAQQTELRQKELRLRNKQIEFETTTGGMREGLVLLNTDNAVISINNAACSIFGIKKSDIADTRISGIGNLGMLLDTAYSGKSAETVLRMGDTDYQANVSPVISDGVVTGAVLFIFDITEHERSEELRREFTTNVSHELKTPLQSVSGYAELIMNGMVKQEDIPAFGSRIYFEAKRMTALIDDIIKLSRLDNGEADMQQADVDLINIVRAEVRAAAPTAEEAQVHIDVRGESAVIHAFPALIGAIVHNLCENAVKYNRKGGSVTVTVRNSEDGAELVLEDTGIGIPPEHTDRVFERFYRVDKSRSKQVGGTGLGLAIVKHAARMHNAEVKLESEPGKGTRVSVMFPRS